MPRWLTVLVTVAVTAAALTSGGTTAEALPNTIPDAPIGMLGDTLRVEYQDETYGRFVADVTVHDIAPTEIPPGWGWQGAPRWRAQGGPWRANVTVTAIEVPNPYIMAASMTLNGVTPGGDSYVSRHTDDPTELDIVLGNVPQGATVHGGVFWDVYRGLVTNVLLLSRKTGTHLAQWNIPG